MNGGLGALVIVGSRDWSLQGRFDLGVVLEESAILRRSMRREVPYSALAFLGVYYWLPCVT